MRTCRRAVHAALYMLRTLCRAVLMCWLPCLALLTDTSSLPSLPASPQELVALVNSRLPEGVEPLRVGQLPHWQQARPDVARK